MADPTATAPYQPVTRQRYRCADGHAFVAANAEGWFPAQVQCGMQMHATAECSQPALQFPGLLASDPVNVEITRSGRTGFKKRWINRRLP